MLFLFFLVVVALAEYGEAFMVSMTPRRRSGPVYLFDKLVESMASASASLRGRKLSEANMASALKEVRRALLEADVNAAVTKGLIDRVKEKAVGAEAMEGVSPPDQFVKYVYDELVRVMGGDDMALEAEKNAMEAGSKRADFLKATAKGPQIVLLCGLQGAGKTTAAAKLAKYVIDEEKKKPLLIAADVYRPAAIEQLKILGESIGAEVYSEETSEEKDAVGIVKRGVEYGKKFDVIIVDTAGRQVVDSDLMTELRDIKALTKPAETLLVLDAMTGQAAASLALEFNEACPLSGSILTKLDGDARGGAALSIRGVAGVPVKFIGVGEKTSDLEPFYPGRMASRILGMGDVLSFVEKAEKKISKKEAEVQMKKLQEGKFDFDDYLAQTQAMKDMGNFASVAKMLPGMAGIDPAQIALLDRKTKVSASMVQSMTKKERANPDLLLRDRTGLSRLKRIAKGSGRSIEDAQNFMREFQALKTQMGRMASGGDKKGGAPQMAMPGAKEAAKKKKKKANKAKMKATAKGFA